MQVPPTKADSRAFWYGVLRQHGGLPLWRRPVILILCAKAVKAGDGDLLRLPLLCSKARLSLRRCLLLTHTGTAQNGLTRHLQQKAVGLARLSGETTETC